MSLNGPPIRKTDTFVRAYSKVDMQDVEIDSGIGEDDAPPQEINVAKNLSKQPTLSWMGAQRNSVAR